MQEAFSHMLFWQRSRALFCVTVIFLSTGGFGVSRFLPAKYRRVFLLSPYSSLDLCPSCGYAVVFHHCYFQFHSWALASTPQPCYAIYCNNTHRALQGSNRPHSKPSVKWPNSSIERLLFWWTSLNSFLWFLSQDDFLSEELCSICCYYFGFYCIRGMLCGDAF